MISSADKKKIAKSIFDNFSSLKEDTVHLSDTCRVYIQDLYPCMSELEIEDELDYIIDYIKKLLKKQNTERSNQGLPPEFETTDHNSKCLIRYSAKYGESSIIACLRKNKNSILQLIKQMSWKKFEFLCTYLLEINGVIPNSITKINQEGVDFIGVYDIGQHVDSRVIPVHYKVRIVGQAKHYSSKIGPDKLRAFNTYCDDIKNDAQKILENPPQWFIAVKTPIIGFFVTTSKFTPKANEYSKNEWLITKDGQQIIEDLIHSPDANLWTNRNKEDVCFDKKRFRTFFDKLGTQTFK